MVFFPSCLKLRLVKSHEELSHHDVHGCTGSSSNSGCVLSHQHSAFFCQLVCSDGPFNKNVFSHYFVPGTVQVYGEKTVKSPFPCLQGTHSVVGDIKKSVVTNYA